MTVEYVIDFYQGRAAAKVERDETDTMGTGTNAGTERGTDSDTGPGIPRPPQLNFYLDVRPKLNSWEGWRMRAERLFGL